MDRIIFAHDAAKSLTSPDSCEVEVKAGVLAALFDIDARRRRVEPTVRPEIELLPALPDHDEHSAGAHGYALFRCYGDAAVILMIDQVSKLRAEPALAPSGTRARQGADWGPFTLSLFRPDRRRLDRQVLALGRMLATSPPRLWVPPSVELEDRAAVALGDDPTDTTHPTVSS